MSDLQGAVAAVEVVQTGGVNELLIHTSQRLREEENKNTANRDEESLIFYLFVVTDEK